MVIDDYVALDNLFMNKRIYSLVVFALAGFLMSCSGPKEGVKEQLLENTRAIARLKTQVELQQELIGRLSDSIKTLADAAKSVQLSLQSLQSSYITLERKLMEKSDTANPAMTSSADFIAELQKDMNSLKVSSSVDGKTIDTVAEKYKPAAGRVIPHFMTEMKANFTDFRYTDRLKKVVARFAASDLKAGLKDYLDDGILRPMVIDIIGRSRSNDVSKILEEAALKTNDADLNMQIGDALIKCKNELGVILLLDQLSSQSLELRLFACRALKKLTGGETFGYNPLQDPKSNEDNVKRWRGWYEESRGKIFAQ